MKNQDFTIEFLVDKSPAEVFKAILNVRKWWSGFYNEEIEGSTSKLNDEFTFLAAGGAHYSKQRLIEMIPEKKLAWLVADSKLTFIEHEQEWIGTKISFEISRQSERTKVAFTHIGLIPQVECYEDCTMGWNQYLRALASDLETNNIIRKK